MSNLDLGDMTSHHCTFYCFESGTGRELKQKIIWPCCLGQQEKNQCYANKRFWEEHEHVLSE